MNSKRILNVLASLELNTICGREQLAGIFKFLKNSHQWNLQLAQSAEEGLARPSAMYKPTSQPDGMIISTHFSPSFSGYCLSHGTPVVLLDLPKSARSERNGNIVHVDVDNDRLTKMAARHLYSLGNFQEYGYVHDELVSDWSVRRGLRFVDFLKDRNRSAKVFKPDTRTRVQGLDTALRTWLKGLRHPAALLVACDAMALKVLSACKMERISIPDQISILSIDNDMLICEGATPTISSIRPDFESEGYEAAVILDDLMRSRKSKRKKVRAKSGDDFILVERETTRTLPPSGMLVARANKFIDDNLTHPFQVADIARAIGVSRRLLDLRFRQIEGCSVLERIVQKRLSVAKRLLKEKKLTILKIAPLCGFNSADNLKRSFRRYFGMSMREWREKRQ